MSKTHKISCYDSKEKCCFAINHLKGGYFVCIIIIIIFTCPTSLVPYRLEAG